MNAPNYLQWIEYRFFYWRSVIVHTRNSSLVHMLSMTLSYFSKCISKSKKTHYRFFVFEHCPMPWPKGHSSVVQDTFCLWTIQVPILTFLNPDRQCSVCNHGVLLPILNVRYNRHDGPMVWFGLVFHISWPGTFPWLVIEFDGNWETVLLFKAFHFIFSPLIQISWLFIPALLLVVVSNWVGFLLVKGDCDYWFKISGKCSVGKCCSASLSDCKKLWATRNDLLRWNY